MSINSNNLTSIDPASLAEGQRVIIVDGNAYVVGTGGVLHCLPLTGGTLTGTLYVAKGNSIMQNVDNNVLRVYGGTSDNSPGLFIFGKDTSGYNGFIYLRTTDGTNTVDFRLAPTGDMRWNNKDITLGYPNYASGTATTANSYTASADGWVSAVRSASTNLLIKVGGKEVLSDVSSAMFPVKKGDVVTFFNTGTSTAVSAKITFFPNR